MVGSTQLGGPCWIWREKLGAVLELNWNGAMRIGFFGGSFDPIHLGHLLHAQDALEAANLDRLALVPAAQAPLKQNGEPGAGAEARCAMIQLAIKGREDFFLLRDEVDRGGISYTVDTVRRLRQRWPEDELFWIIGADQLAQLDQWREIDQLLEMATFLCLRRPGHPADIPKGVPQSRLRWVGARELRISSTEIRERIRAGRPIDFFLPPAIVSHIEKNELYRR